MTVNNQTNENNKTYIKNGIDTRPVIEQLDEVFTKAQAMKDENNGN